MVLFMLLRVFSLLDSDLCVKLSEHSLRWLIGVYGSITNPYHSNLVMSSLLSNDCL